MHQFEAVYPQDLREERSSVTLTQSMETVDPQESENVAACVCQSIDILRISMVRASSHLQWPGVQKSPTRPLCRDSHWKPSVAWTAIQKTTPFTSPLYLWQTPELCAQSHCVLRSPFRRASHSKTVDRDLFPCCCIRQKPNV